MFEQKNENNSYPLALIKSYAAHEISRIQFTYQLSSWQKLQGINYDCKGTSDRSGMFVTYRGIKAAIRNGFLNWENNTASTFFEFRRKVDFIKIEGALWN